MRKKKEEKKIQKEEKVVVEKNLEPIFYILGRDEELSSIAKKFNTSVEEIRQLNNNSTMFAGNQIRVK